MTEILNKKVEALTYWQQPILCEPVKGGITNLNFRDRKSTRLNSSHT